MLDRCNSQLGQQYRTPNRKSGASKVSLRLVAIFAAEKRQESTNALPDCCSARHRARSLTLSGFAISVGGGSFSGACEYGLNDRPLRLVNFVVLPSVLPECFVSCRALSYVSYGNALSICNMGEIQ